MRQETTEGNRGNRRWILTGEPSGEEASVISKKTHSTGEVARIVDLPLRTITRYCATGRIRAIQHPISKTWKVEHDDLIDFMNENDLDTARLTPPAKVMIVDDEEGVVRYIRAVFNETDWNATVDSTTDGYDALVKIGADVPDLVILDVIMPGMNGKEVLRSLRQSERTKSLKILAISAFPEEIDEMRRIGADAALPKPFKAAALRETVLSLLPGIAGNQTSAKKA
jgi:CheY-like chemotaxis protein